MGYNKTTCVVKCCYVVVIITIYVFEILCQIVQIAECGIGYVYICVCVLHYLVVCMWCVIGFATFQPAGRDCNNHKGGIRGGSR